MIDVTYSIAFAAGLVSFFAPCVVPLLPAYIGYVTGVSASDLKEKGYTSEFIKKILLSSLLYILGFSLVFVLMGSAVSGLGIVFRRYNLLIERFGGLVILILGLEFAGFLHLPFLAKEHKATLPKWAKRLGYGRAFVVGIIFATAWTPCVGAILGSILALAAGIGTTFKGALLLLAYSLGISLPFLIVTLTLASAPRYVKSISRYVGPISKVSGIIMAVLGLLLLTNTYGLFNSWLLTLLTKIINQ